MASTEAIQFVESLLQRTDRQTRDILATYEPGAEVDTINVIIGDGATVIVAGVAAALRVDFRARITGIFLQEFDGTSGSVAVAIAKAQGGAAPSWVTISGTAAISSGRYFADEDLSSWSDTRIDRGDYLRFSVSSASTITRVHLALRIRRLEP
jgi:hypothetical protein